MTLLKTVTLIPKTRHGKNVIQRFGDQWTIRKAPKNFQPTFTTNAPGPWLQLEPVGSKDDLRWVSVVGDKDFKVKI